MSTLSVNRLKSNSASCNVYSTVIRSDDVHEIGTRRVFFIMQRPSTKAAPVREPGLSHFNSIQAIFSQSVQSTPSLTAVVDLSVSWTVTPSTTPGAYYGAVSTGTCSLQGVSKQQYMAMFPSAGHYDIVECCDLLLLVFSGRSPGGRSTSAA